MFAFRKQRLLVRIKVFLWIILMRPWFSSWFGREKRIYMFCNRRKGCIKKDEENIATIGFQSHVRFSTSFKDFLVKFSKKFAHFLSFFFLRILNRCVQCPDVVLLQTLRQIRFITTFSEK